MKVKIRRGVFETNSSSIHCMTICSLEEYESWKEGNLLYDEIECELVEITGETEGSVDYLTYDEFQKRYGYEYDTFAYEETTPKGEQIVAFGYYGEDC